ncbi:hypothetical protein IJX73_02870 [bacterium]|nr:hypothetical protein [bacterium]
MILTKSEFRDQFKFKNLSSVSNLLKNGDIVANKDGCIDLQNKKNKKWAKEREKKLEQEANEKQAQKELKAQQEAQKHDINYQILQQKLDENLTKAKILNLKYQKENKEVVETEVLNRVITTIFDTLFKNLAELPAKNIEEVLNIFEINDKPKEAIIAFLTEKILTILKTALEAAEKKAKKYYEE